MPQTRHNLCVRLVVLSLLLPLWHPTQQFYDWKGLRQCACHLVREKLNRQWSLHLILPSRMTANETTVHVPDGGSEEISRNNVQRQENSWAQMVEQIDR